MDLWIYNNKVVQRHSFYPLCKSTLNDVSNRDYPNTDFFNPDIECLDMDTYEKNILRRDQPNHTVDAVIGIANYENNHAHNSRLLLVELRINYKSVSNISKSEIEGKVTHTKALLGGEICINKESIFIFNNELISQAKWWFNREKRTGGEFAHCEAWSIKEFSTNIKSIVDLPYQPTYKEEDIINDIQQYEKKSDWMSFLKQIKFWCNKSEEFRYCNRQEYDYIKNIITKVWTEFKRKKYQFNDNEELEKLILEEDYTYLKEENV